MKFKSIAIALALTVSTPAIADLTFPNLTYRTGAFAVSGIPYADGFADYMTLLNERDGGIGGEKINYIECETQYKVEKGDKLKVEKLDKEAGKSIKINDVLMVIDGEKVTVGTPIVKEAHVNAKIESHGRGPKIKIIKFRRRKHHRKQMGHRQAYTEIKITNIAVN